MFAYVHDAMQMDFVDAWLKHGGPFEILPYYLHIHARKLETVNSIYSKYLLLETEREMIRYGLGKLPNTLTSTPPPRRCQHLTIW